MCELKAMMAYTFVSGDMFIDAEAGDGEGRGRSLQRSIWTFAHLDDGILSPPPRRASQRIDVTREVGTKEAGRRDQD